MVNQWLNQCSSHSNLWSIQLSKQLKRRSTVIVKKRALTTMVKAEVKLKNKKKSAVNQ
jgi:hypothetical protein